MKLWHILVAMILAGVGGYTLHKQQHQAALVEKIRAQMVAKNPALAKNTTPDKTADKTADKVDDKKPEPRPKIIPPKPAPAKDDTAKTDPSKTFAVACKDLSLKLMRCEPYVCSYPLPMQSDFTVKHTIMGKAENGLCVHMQTAPHDKLVVCHYSDEMKLLVAKNLQVPRPEALSPDEEAMMNAEFPVECEVFDTKTGKRME